jgi:hypothetical protein
MGLVGMYLLNDRLIDNKYTNSTKANKFSEYAYLLDLSRATFRNFRNMSRRVVMTLLMKSRQHATVLIGLLFSVKCTSA